MDGSPWPVAQTTAFFRVGLAGLEMSQIWKPLKLPWKTRLPRKARSELAKVSPRAPPSPVSIAGLLTCDTSRSPLIAEPASVSPALRPTRGSVVEAAVAIDGSGVGATTPDQVPDAEPMDPLDEVAHAAT